MNKYLRGLAAVFSATLALGVLSGCNLIAVDPVKEAQEVIVRAKDQTLSRREYMNIYSMYAGQYGFTYDDVSENNMQLKAYAMQTAAGMLVQKVKAKDLGYSNFTDAEKADAEKKAQEALDSSYESAKSYYETLAKDDPSIDPKAKADTEKEEGLKLYTMEMRVKDQLDIIAEEKMTEDQCKDIAVTDEEVKAEYDTRVKEAKDGYAETPDKYTQDFSSQTDESKPLYVPAGYVYVKNLLVKITDAQLSEIQALRAETEDEEKQKQADELQAKYLKEIEAKAKEALEKAKAKPDDFDALIETYGEDPGMKEEPGKSKGYAVGKDSGMVKTFEDACLKLAKDGDISELVASDYGYHIIKRIGASEEYTRPLDELKEEIKTSLLEGKKGERMTELMKKWTEEVNPKMYYDRVGVSNEVAKAIEEEINATPTPTAE